MPRRAPMSVPFPGSPDDMMNTIAVLRARFAPTWMALRKCAAECVVLRARVAKLEEATVDAAASLAAAISLLERGGKKAAPSDKMFEQMLVDYCNSLERARAVLKDTPQ